MSKLDYIFLIPTYERYDMLINIIEDINKQCENIKYKIILVDDCSKDVRYDNITTKYENIIYFKNDVNGGKTLFYKTISKLISEGIKLNATKYVFLADDLQLSKNFIKYLDKIFEDGNKVINFLLSFEELYENWGFKYWVDGAFAISGDIVNNINTPMDNYKLPKSEKLGSGVWKEITKRFYDSGIQIYYPKYSLVNHLGHTESVMHPDLRKETPLFTNNFIDNYDEWDIFRSQIFSPSAELGVKFTRKKVLKREKETKLVQQKEKQEAINERVRETEVSVKKTRHNRSFIIKNNKIL